MGKGSKIVDLLECLNLSDYKFKTSRYNYRSTYMNPMVIPNQKPTIDTQKQERKNRNIPLNEISKPQGKKLKEEEKNKEGLPKQLEDKQ